MHPRCLSHEVRKFANVFDLQLISCKRGRNFKKLWLYFTYLPEVPVNGFAQL